MFRMNRCWRLCQWLALGAFTVAMAGCAPTTEREGGDPAPLSSAAKTSGSPAKSAKRVATTELGVDGYDLSSRLMGPPDLMELGAMPPQVDNYINSRYKERSGGEGDAPARGGECRRGRSRQIRTQGPGARQ